SPKKGRLRDRGHDADGEWRSAPYHPWVRLSHLSERRMCHVVSTEQRGALPQLPRQRRRGSRSKNLSQPRRLAVDRHHDGKRAKRL
ncbi:MAG TPA: hypothetical protein VJH06_02945, partial [Candidatus Paceibacterota bacterium]